MKKIGVLLAGCGHRDGSEVHEATLALLAIDAAGAQAHCFAPRGPQTFTRNHFTGEETDEKRDMFIESARIARGKIRDIAVVTATDFDALVIPGGQGAALNLSTFLVDGPRDCKIRHDVGRIIVETVKTEKPLGAICVAPATVGKVLEGLGIRAKLTLGSDPEMQGSLELMGQEPKECPTEECVVDETNRIVSTPAYMSAKSIGQVKQGIDNLMKAIMGML